MRDDEQTDEQTDESPLEAMQREMDEAIETVRTETRDEAVDFVLDFARELKGKRSKRPKYRVEKRTEEEPKRVERRGDAVTVEVLTPQGQVIEAEYRKMERGLSQDERLEFRAARSSVMDGLTKQWMAAMADGWVEKRMEIAAEMDDRYLEALGVPASERQLLTGTPSPQSGYGAGTGGALVPLPLANQLMTARNKAAKFRSLVNVFPMSAATERVPLYPIATAATRAENAAFTPNTPAADDVLLYAKSLGVEFGAGRDFLEDSAFNMSNVLTRVAGEAIAAGEDLQIAQAGDGTGSNFTESLATANITDTFLGTPGTSDYDLAEIIALYFGLPEQYRREAVFFCNSATQATLSGIVDGNGRPIFFNAVEAPIPLGDVDPAASGVLYGKPLYDVPTPDAELYFGNPMWWALGDRAGVRVYASMDDNTQQTTWVIDERADSRGVPIDQGTTEIGAFRKSVQHV